MANANAVIQQAAAKYGISPKVLTGVYGTETSFGRDVKTSSTGAQGPFQLEPATARSLGVKDPNNFKEAAYGAARYLAQYKGRGFAGMVSAYNAGPGGGIIPSYVSSVAKFGNVGNVSEPTSTSVSTGSSSAPQRTSLPSAPSFDSAGFQQANRRAILGRLLASEGGEKNNPLFASGLVTTKSPIRSEYETAGNQPLRSVSTGGVSLPSSPEGGPAQVGLHPAVNPKVPIDLKQAEQKYGYAKGNVPAHGFPLGEPGHTSPGLTALFSHPEAPPIAQHPSGNVHKTMKGPVFVPNKTPRPSPLRELTGQREPAPFPGRKHR
jgi:hypothetical protein